MVQNLRPIKSLFQSRSNWHWTISWGSALGSGLLMAQADPAVGIWGLAWVALAPLWWLVSRDLGLGQSMLLAMAWGLGYYGPTLFWITGLHPLTWLGVPWLASLLIAGSCWGFVTLWGTAQVILWAGLLYILSRFPHPLSPGGRLLLGVALWCGLEVLWSWGPLDWNSLALTQSPGNPWLLHLGQLSGPTGISAVLVGVNGLLAETWRERPHRREFMAMAGVLIVVAHGLGLGLYVYSSSVPDQERLTVGVIQGNIPTRIKLEALGLQQSWQAYTQGYRELAAAGVEAVLTPEGAIPVIWAGATAATNPLTLAVKAAGVDLWLGTFTSSSGGLARSLLNILGDGRVSSYYDKQKLVPLGEYTPFESLLGRWRLSLVALNGAAGTPNQHLETPWGRAAVAICYESAFPEVLRTQVAQGARFILSSANLDPFGRALMAQHQAQDAMRAVENDRWALRATNTGYSGVIDPHGQIRWRSAPHTYTIHHGEIGLRQTRTPYDRWGDWLTPILLGSAGLNSIGGRWGRSQGA